LITATIHVESFAELDELTECEVKLMTKMFANDLRYDFDFQTYTVYFDDENWVLANLRMPGLDKILRTNNAKT